MNEEYVFKQRLIGQLAGIKYVLGMLLDANPQVDAKLRGLAPDAMADLLLASPTGDATNAGIVEVVQELLERNPIPGA